MSFWDSIGDGFQWLTGTGSGSPQYEDYQNLNKLGGQAQDFGNQQSNNFNAGNAGLNHTYQGLDDAIAYQQKLASGQNSVSAEQLRNGLQQQLAQQRSMAASASPQNSAMAARNAAMNMGNASYGMAGQQAIAGLQERNQAQQNMGGLYNTMAQTQLGQNNQYLQGALGGYQQANNAYGAGIKNPPASVGQAVGGALTSVLGMI